MHPFKMYNSMTFNALLLCSHHQVGFGIFSSPQKKPSTFSCHLPIPPSLIRLKQRASTLCLYGSPRSGHFIEWTGTLSVSVCLLSFTWHNVSTFVHVVARVRACILCLAELQSLVRMDHTSFIRSSVDGPLACFLAILKLQAESERRRERNCFRIEGWRGDTL